MNLKKFAMFTLTLTLITGVISTPVSAFASETETVSENVTIVENSSVDELVETEGENTYLSSLSFSPSDFVFNKITSLIRGRFTFNFITFFF